MDAYQTLRTASSGRRLGFLLKDTALYGLTTAVTKLMGLITLPILTKLLTPEQYGLIDSLSVLLAVVIGVCTLGQDSAIARFFYDTEDAQERRQIVSQGLVIQLVFALTVSLLLIAGHRLWLSKLYGSDRYAPELFLALLSIPAALVLNAARNLLKWTFARGSFITLSLGLSACQTVLIVGFVWGGGWEVRGYVLAVLISSVAFALLGAYFCRGYWTPASGYVRLRRMLAFGWPYMVTAVVSYLVPAVDRMCVISALSLEQAGYYAVGFRVASLILFPVMAFQTSWGPFCYALYKEPDAAETYNRILLYFVLVVAFGAFALSVLAVPIIKFLARPEYLAGADAVLPLAFGGALQGISWITGIGIDLSKRSSYSFVSYSIGLLVTLAGMWALVADFGIFGVATGVMLGSLAQCISYTVFGYLCYPLRFQLRRPVAALVTAAVAGCLCQGLAEPVGWGRGIWSGVWLLALAALFWAVILPRKERESLTTWTGTLWLRVRG